MSQERSQAINQSFGRFRKIRHQKLRDLAGVWVSLDLQAGGQPALTRDEERVVEAACDCGWMQPYRTEPPDEVDVVIAKPVRRPAPGLFMEDMQ